MRNYDFNWLRCRVGNRVAGVPRTLWEIAQPFGLRCRAENSVRKRSAYRVGAGVPAKNPTRCLAPAPPVFVAVRRLDTPALMEQIVTL
ncbi:hypothetical protein D3C85_1581480 [compost metagenome]